MHGRLPVVGQQQQGPRQPLLGGVQQLIDQVLLDADVPGQDVGEKAIGERGVLVDLADHLVPFDGQDRAGRHRGRVGHPV